MLCGFIFHGAPQQLLLDYGSNILEGQKVVFLALINAVGAQRKLLCCSALELLAVSITGSSMPTPPFFNRSFTTRFDHDAAALTLQATQ